MCTALLADQGNLWAFRATGKNGSPVDPANAFNGAIDYGDVASGDWPGAGHRSSQRCSRQRSSAARIPRGRSP